MALLLDSQVCALEICKFVRILAADDVAQLIEGLNCILALWDFERFDGAQLLQGLELDRRRVYWGGVHREQVKQPS